MSYLYIFATFAAGAIIVDILYILSFYCDIIIKTQALLSTLINLRAYVIGHLNNAADEEICNLVLRGRRYFCPARSYKCEGCIPGEQPLCTNN